MECISYRRAGAGGLTRVFLTRGRRRVLLALLSGADNLHGARLCRVAQVWPGALYPFLDHLLQAGWIRGEQRMVEHRKTRCYCLTYEGRMRAMAELGLIFPPA